LLQRKPLAFEATFHRFAQLPRQLGQSATP
jgi:hypothetical protein